MQFYETPFFILGVSICDNRRTIQEKSDIFSIRDIGDVNEYVRLLTNAHKRIQIELRWLLGSDQEEISKISDTYANISRIRNANITNLIKSKSDVSALVEMNQLTAMLPFVKDDNVDGFVFEISRRYDEIQDGFGKLISALNTYRQTASFPLIDEIELKNALREYLTDINSDLQKRIVALRASSSLNYQILISRISSFGFSPVIDSLIREYELFITRDLCEYENEVHILAQRLGNSLDDDELSARVIDIQQAARKWKEDILPLQKYELTLGIDTVTRDHERAIIIALDDCYNRLFSFGEKAYKYAYSIACSMLDNLPDDGAHTADRNVVLSRIEKLKPIVDKAEYEKYRALAEAAWQREVQDSDKRLRTRAAEHAKEERQRIVEKAALEKNRKMAEDAWEKEKLRYAQIEREQAAESAKQEQQRIEKKKQDQYRKKAEEAWEREKERYASMEHEQAIEAAKNEKERIEQQKNEQQREQLRKEWEKRIKDRKKKRLKVLLPIIAAVVIVLAGLGYYFFIY